MKEKLLIKKHHLIITKKYYCHFASNSLDTRQFRIFLTRIYDRCGHQVRLWAFSEFFFIKHQIRHQRFFYWSDPDFDCSERFELLISEKLKNDNFFYRFRSLIFFEINFATFRRHFVNKKKLIEFCESFATPRGRRKFLNLAYFNKIGFAQILTSWESLIKRII